ncbi:MAG: T9SS type A sorting domain-containing protein [Bacteroidota bacterium]|nr:T9SS type A sorting domain-containing protein [Bacteroidota bacterium]
MLDHTEYVLDDPDILTYYLVTEKKPLGTNTPPPTPVQLLPHDRLPVLEDSVLFVWKPVSGADNYRFQIAKDFLFNNLVFSDSGLTDTTFIFRQLELNVEYFWRVQAINSNGYSCYTIRSLKYIIPPIRTPGLIFPSYNAIGISRTPVLMWTRVQVATSYELQVATDGSFNNLVFHDSTITTTYQQIGPLEIDKLYYWRVRAKNSEETSHYSYASHFTVSLPLVPKLWSPLDKASGVSMRPDFVWDGLIGATNYRLQIARDSLFLDIVFDDTTLTLNSTKVGPLTINAKYYWRVQAWNACGWGNYSLVREFTVSFPSVPILKLPPNEAIDVALKSQFYMYSQFGAKFYNLQLSTDSLFNQIVHEDTLGFYAYITLGPFTASTLYYWRARAINDNGVSEFSLISQFTTGTDSISLRFTIPLIVQANSSVKKDTLKFGGHRLGTDCIDQNIGEDELQPLAPGYDVRFMDSRTGYESCLGNGVKFDFRSWPYGTKLDSFQISIQAEPSDYPIIISWPAYIGSYYDFIEIWEVGGTQIVDMMSSRNTIISNHSISKLKMYAMKYFEGTWTSSIKTRSPADGAEITTLTPTLTWNVAEGAINYRIQVATNPLFYNPIIDVFPITQTFLTVGPLNQATKYYWRVQVNWTSLPSQWTWITRFNTPSIIRVKDDEIISKVYQLYQNYPNPFNPHTSIEFQLKEESYVAIQVFNTLGQQVAVLTNREIYEEGRHEILFEAENLPSGVYFYRMVIESLGDKIEQQTFMKKMLLLK